MTSSATDMTRANGRFDLALFDLDGCLIDSTPAITRSLLHALVEVGVDTYEQDELSWCVGPPLFDSVATLLERADADVALSTAVVEAYRARYRRTSLEETEVIDGIPATLTALAAAGLGLGVVTSKPAPFALPLLEGLGLRRHFRAVHAPALDEISEAKAVTLRRALDELAPSSPPDLSVMIGDRSHDVAAGIACGTGTVGVTWGAGSRDELTDAGAAHIVDRPAELVGALT